MAVKPRKKEKATESHDSIAAQTAAFLKSGGEIQQIDRGVTSQNNLAGPKHLVLGNR